MIGNLVQKLLFVTELENLKHQIQQKIRQNSSNSYFTFYGTLKFTLFIFRSFYFTVKPGPLAFTLGILEPFFCALTLYQLDPKTKEVFQISEKYHFQNNPKHILEYLESNWVKKTFFKFHNRYHTGY